MTIRKKNQDREIVIDLAGPEGNAYVLLSYAKQYAKQLDLDYAMIESDMTSGNYEHLIKTFDKYFGTFVTLEV